MTKKSKDYQMKTVVWGVSTVGDDCKYLGSIVCKDIVHSVSFSPDDKWLAVGSEDRTIALLSVANRFEKTMELACAAGVLCLAWSHDSRFLASGGEDMKISMWDLQSRKMIFQLPKAHDWYSTVAFHPSMRSFATCGFSDSSVTIHPLEIEDVKAPPKSPKGSPLGASKLKVTPKPKPAPDVKVQDDEDYADEEFEPDPDLENDDAEAADAATSDDIAVPAVITVGSA
jgi:WD40 repeat protein